MNHTKLTACIAELSALRYTPAGLPALDLMLEHSSQQTEADHPRQVRLELRATAFGDQAETLSRQALGVGFEFSGFLVNSRNGKGVVLQIQDFTPIS